MTDPVSRRTVLGATLAAGLLPLAAPLGAAGPVTARDVFRQIKLASGQPGSA